MLSMNWSTTPNRSMPSTYHGAILRTRHPDPIAAAMGHRIAPSCGKRSYPLLADFIRLWKQKTSYSQPSDWVFPSFRLEGKQPRVANMLVEDHLHPAAVKAGVLSSHCDIRGHLVDDDPRRFGFTIFATASRRFSSAPEPIPKPCKHSFAIATSS